MCCCCLCCCGGKAGEGEEMDLSDHLMPTMTMAAVFKDYTCKINSMDFHNMYDYLVTTSDDESIRLYDTANATCVKTINSKKYGVDQICFTHQKTEVVYSSKNGWDESLRHLSLLDNRFLRYFKGHRDSVVSLCLCPTSDTLLSASLDHTVRFWDLRSTNCQGLMRVRGRPSVAYDHRGLVFAISCDGGFLKLFDVRKYEKGPFDSFLIEGDSVEVSNMKFSYDGRLMLLSTTGSIIYVIDAFSGKKLHTLMLEHDPGGGTFEATFSPDGQYIVSGSGDGIIHVWSTVSGQEVASWMNTPGVPAAIVKWAPHRLMFASASHVLGFWTPDLSKLNYPLHHIPGIPGIPGTTDPDNMPYQ